MIEKLEAKRQVLKKRAEQTKIDSDSDINWDEDDEDMENDVEKMTADVTELPTTRINTSMITSNPLQNFVKGVDIQNVLATQISTNVSTDEEMFDEAMPEHAVLHSLRSEFVLMDSVLQFLA